MLDLARPVRPEAARDAISTPQHPACPPARLPRLLLRAARGPLDHPELRCLRTGVGSALGTARGILSKRLGAHTARPDRRLPRELFFGLLLCERSLVSDPLAVPRSDPTPRPVTLRRPALRLPGASARSAPLPGRLSAPPRQATPAPRRRHRRHPQECSRGYLAGSALGALEGRPLHNRAHRGSKDVAPGVS